MRAASTILAVLVALTLVSCGTTSPPPAEPEPEVRTRGFPEDPESFDVVADQVLLILEGFQEIPAIGPVAVPGLGPLGRFLQLAVEDLRPTVHQALVVLDAPGPGDPAVARELRLELAGKLLTVNRRRAALHDGVQAMPRVPAEARAMAVDLEAQLTAPFDAMVGMVVDIRQQL